jgi:hypothetical protein
MMVGGTVSGTWRQGMVMTNAFAALTLVAAFLQEGQEAWRLIEAASGIKDAQFMFESFGDRLEPDGKVTADDPREFRSGNLWWHGSGGLRWDWLTPCAGGNAHEQYSLRELGGAARNRREYPDAALPAQDLLLATSSDALGEIWQPTYLWPLPHIKLSALGGRRRLRFDGEEQIDGHLCSKLIVTAGDLGNGDFVFEWRLWLDLPRNGQCLRIEGHQGRGKLELRFRSRDVVLWQAKAEDGRQVWFPRSGIVDWYDYLDQTGKLVMGAKALTKRRLGILPGSVKLNVGFKPETLDVVFDKNVAVWDRIQAADHRADQPLGKPATNDRVRETVAAAKATKSDLEGMARAPAASSKSSWWTWLLSLCGIGVLALAWRAGRKS